MAWEHRNPKGCRLCQESSSRRKAGTQKLRLALALVVGLHGKESENNCSGSYKEEPANVEAKDGGGISTGDRDASNANLSREIK